MAFQFSIAQKPRSGNTTLGIITSLGLTANLKLCLDAGNSSSYTSGQSWLDMAGGGYDFFRGTDGTSQASDPTFNGTPDGWSSSEYWSFDGGDMFTYDTTNETWMQNLHKNNALFTYVAWIYGMSAGTSVQIFGTNGGSAGTGVAGVLRLDGTSSPLLFVTNAGVSVATINIAHGSSLASRWNFIALSVDEAAGTSAGRVNEVTATPSSTYSSPASGNASYTMQLMAQGNSAQIAESGTRSAVFAMWEGVALTAANITSIYTATRTTFGV